MWTGTLILAVFLCTAAPAAACPRRQRIIGGRDAEDGEFPYVVSLQAKVEGVWEHHCGGVVLDERHVLTAGHCMCDYEYLEFPELYVVAGTRHLYNESAPNRVTLLVEQYYYHEEYSYSHGSHDIAILRLARNLPSNNPYIGTLPLASKTPESPTVCTVSGWGVTYYPVEEFIYPEIMQTLNLPLINHGKCSEIYKEGFIYTVDETMMCSGWEDKGVCSGDSGTAVVCDGKITGLVCWGFECAIPEYPGVSTDVAYHRQWIADTLERSYADAARPRGAGLRTVGIKPNNETCVWPVIPEGVRPLIGSPVKLKKGPAMKEPANAS